VNPEPAISVKGIFKRFGARIAVDHVSMQVEPGEIAGFLGPNGSGKTTMRVICGLLTPDQGEGQVLGLDLRRDPEAIKREIGDMTQSFSLYTDLSIEETLDDKQLREEMLVRVPAKIRSADEAAFRCRCTISRNCQLKMPSLAQGCQ